MPDTSINVLSPSAEKLLAGRVAAAPGDAEVVQLAERFIADELAKELKLVRFYNMAKPWSVGDR
jgi:hypothetical protein